MGIRNIELFGDDVAQVVAIAERDPVVREYVKKVTKHACPVFATVEEVIAFDVDAFIVCTPNYNHIEVLRQIIPTGKHILCEKPLCSTVSHCREVERMLVEREDMAKLEGAPPPGIFMVGMEYRWMPPISRLIEEVDSGKHGDLLTLAIREHRFPFLVKVENWNRFNRYTGGTLVEKGCHFFDLMRRIIRSEPVSIFASGGQAQNHKDEVYGKETPDIIDHAFIVVEFANGAKASLDLCMFAEDEQNEQVIAICERGKVEARSPESVVRIVERRHVSGTTREPLAPEQRAVPKVHEIPVPKELAAAGYHEGATYHELRAFVDSARHVRLPPVSAHDGTMAVAMGVAAHESIRTGKVCRMQSLEALAREDDNFLMSSDDAFDVPFSRL